MIARTAALLVLLLPTPALADTLIDNINGISVDRAGRVDQFTGMVIDNEGRVRELLDFGDDPVEAVAYRIDGEGRTVLPGFVDAHLHLSSLGFGTMVLDLSSSRSLEDAQSRLAAYAAAHPDRPWIVGRGWNQEVWGLGRFPTAAEIDVIVSDRPVWLERVDGHAGWANTLALTAGNVTAATREPEGGRIERVGTTRTPAGVLVDNAMPLVASAVPPPLPEDRDMAIYAAQRLLFANGITAAADMGTSIEDWMALRRAGDAGWLQMRVMAYADSVETMLLIGGPGPTQWLYDDRLRLNGVKLYLDGALGSRGALLKAPYADDLRTNGPPSMGLAIANGTQLRNNMSRAAMDDFQVAIHAIGDAANGEALSAIEDLAGDYGGDRRWRIEHAQVVDPTDIARFGQHTIIASMQPTHQTSDRLMAEARLGPDRLAGAYAWRSIARAGAPLAFGSDAPVERPDPFAGLAAAISRTDADGAPEGGWQPQEVVSREAALSAFTAAAAYAGFAEGRFGRLAPGEGADFVVLDGNPLELSAAQIRHIRVLETWVGGQKVFDANAPVAQENAPTE